MKAPKVRKAKKPGSMMTVHAMLRSGGGVHKDSRVSRDGDRKAWKKEVW